MKNDNEVFASREGGVLWDMKKFPAFILDDEAYAIADAAYSERRARGELGITGEELAYGRTREVRDLIAKAMEAADSCPDPQTLAAYLLAAYHCHGWAGPSCPASLEDASKEYAAWLAEGNGGQFAGVSVPDRDPGGCLRWTTGTGRLRWNICRDGTTLLIVTRPGDIVAATATVGPRASTVAVHVNGDVAEERHLVALALALAAIGVAPDRYAWSEP